MFIVVTVFFEALPIAIWVPPPPTVRIVDSIGVHWRIGFFGQLVIVLEGFWVVGVVGKCFAEVFAEGSAENIPCLTDCGMYLIRTYIFSIVTSSL